MVNKAQDLLSYNTVQYKEFQRQNINFVVFVVVLQPQMFFCKLFNVILKQPNMFSENT